MGRTRKLDDDLELKLLKHLRHGVSRRDSCAACSLGYSTFERWLKEGADLEADHQLRGFRGRVQRAEAMAKIQLISAVRRASATEWKPAAWLLERKWPEEFGRRDHVTQEVTVREGEAQQVEDAMADPEMRKAMEDVSLILAKRQSSVPTNGNGVQRG